MTTTIKNYSTTGFTLAADGDAVVTLVNGTVYTNVGAGIDGTGRYGYIYDNGDIAGNYGIIIGNASGTSSSVVIGTFGSVIGTNVGIILNGFSVVTNAGNIVGDIGLYNNSGTANVTLVNTGTINGSGSAYSYSYYSGGAIDNITNTGTMVGNIALGSGNDLYDGRGGTVVGTVDGGGGNDILIGGSGADKLFDVYGSNWIVGGGGDDTVTIGSYSIGGGTSTAWAGEANFGTDNSTNDTLIVTGDGASIFLGGVVYNAAAGTVASWIWGFENATGTFNGDTIIGTGGNNIIDGNGGADWLVGGGGYDQFVFDGLNVSGSQIRDFSHDIIDLHNIDANTTVSGDQAFTYHTTHTSNAAGEMVFTNYGSGGQIDLYVNADNTIDATIYVGYASGNPAPTVSDFWL